MSAADALPEYDVRTRHSIRVDASPELAVAAAHYPPGGSRSWGPFAPLWGREAPGPAQASPQLAAMVESARSLANVDAIAAVPGVDLLFVGPFDLTETPDRQAREGTGELP